MNGRVIWCLGLVVAMAISLAAPKASSEDYPSRPLRIVVPYAAGGTADVTARLMAAELQERLGQPVLVENRPGAATKIALDVVREAKPDGYTLGLTASDMSMLPYLLKNPAGYRPTDYTQIVSYASNWFVYAISPIVPAHSLAELVSYAKANPGKLRFGASPAGSLQLSFEVLKQQAGIDVEFVPYKGGGAQTLTAVMSGEIEVVPLGLSNAQGAESGGLRVIVQTGPERHPLIPRVPTVAEAGFPAAMFDARFGLMGPRNLPSAITSRLVDAAEAATKDARFQKKLFEIGTAPTFLKSAALEQRIADESKTFEKLIADLKIPPLD